jgi:peptide/nickel transport system substrate-binding protein
VTLLSLAACGGGTATTTPTPATGDTAAPDGGAAATTPEAGASAGKDTLNIAIISDEGTLDIRYMTGGVYAAAVEIMEPLWDVTEEKEPIMVLAESVEQVSDSSYIVHLRQNVTFSNGNPFTAEDVLFSIDRFNEAGASGQPRVQTIDPAKTKAIDDYTIDLQLYAPNVAHWQILTQFFVYDKESFDETAAKLKPIGTGPYKLTEYVPNSVTKLERREDYWGAQPAVKYLNFMVLAEPSQRANALATGLVDVSLVATDDVEYAKGLSGYNLDSRYTGYYNGMNFNFGAKSKLGGPANLEKRRAVVHAIDPQVFIDVVYSGQGKVMHAVIPDLCFDYEDRFTDMDDTYKIGYNVELAKELAQSSGLTGQTLRLMTAGTAEAIKMAEITQSMLGEIGVNVEIFNYDPATAWQMSYDPDADYDFTLGPGGITPNRVVGDQLLNGVRYSPTLTIPGAFENNEEYLRRAPETMSTVDPAKLSDVLFDLLGQYERAVIGTGVCNITVSNAYSTVIDLNTLIYSVGTGFVRFQDIKLVA